MPPGGPSANGGGTPVTRYGKTVQGVAPTSKNRPAGVPAPGASVLPTGKGKTFTKQATSTKIRVPR